MTEITDDAVELLTKLANDLLPLQLRNKIIFGSWSADLWKAIEAAGITTAPLPESAGGASLTFRALAPIIKRTGALALPLPLAEHFVATLLLLDAGIAIPTSRILTVASSIASDTPLTKASSGNSLYVSGDLHDVPWGNEADFVVTTLGHATVALIPRGEDVQLTYNLAGEPRVTYKYHHVKCAAYAQIADIEQEVCVKGALIRALQLTGAMEKILQITVEYAQTRSQFNKPLIRMQVIQQMLARLAGQVAAANAAITLALESLEHQDTSFFVGAAKSRVSEAAGVVAALAHQIHGAIGFTQEYELHLYSTRLWAWREEFGNERHWNTVLASRVSSAEPALLWNRVTANDQYAT